MDLQTSLNHFRKKPLFQPELLSEQLSYGPEAVKLVIPHREPMLFLDRITALDLARASIAGERSIAEDDPVFAGHFPGDPVYPGTLQAEALGQLATALIYFLEAGTARIDPERPAPIIRATKILGALFLEPVPPGSTLVLLGSRTEWDGLVAQFIGQALIGRRVVCALAGELCVFPAK